MPGVLDLEIRLRRGGLAVFLYTLPATIVSFLGWILFLVGFGWLNGNVFKLENLYSSNYGRGTVAGFYFLAIAPPIYFIIHSAYRLTGLWIIGIFNQLGAALVMIFSGGIAYYGGNLMFFLLIDSQAGTPYDSSIPLSNEEKYIIVLFVGSMIIAVGVLIAEVLIPVMNNFHYHKLYRESASRPDYIGMGPGGNNQTVKHMKSLLFVLPTMAVALVGWIIFLVGFGLLNHQVFLPRDLDGQNAYSTHYGRWQVAWYYSLAITVPLHFIISSLYMVTGLSNVGALSQLGATVVTLAAGALVYSTGVAVTLYSESSDVLQDSQNYFIVVFVGTLLLCISMAAYHALVPVISSLIHYKPHTRQSASEVVGHDDHEMIMKSI